MALILAGLRDLNCSRLNWTEHFGLSTEYVPSGLVMSENRDGISFWSYGKLLCSFIVSVRALSGILQS